MELKDLLNRMNILLKTNRMERTVASSMLVVTSDRIFDKGKAADNSDIGTYSPGYLKQRVKNNYPSSRKVILQAERQMLNDFSVISSDTSVGLGFKNSFNADKSRWVEETYKKPIFEHTNIESKQLFLLANKEVSKILKNG